MTTPSLPKSQKKNFQKVSKIFIPIKTISEANSSLHWSKKHKLHKMQKYYVKLFLNKGLSLPCTVVLTRQAPRRLDDDNLVTALKYVRDAVADKLIPGLPPGQADDDNRIKWGYDQITSKKAENGHKYGVWIEIKTPD